MIDINKILEEVSYRLPSGIINLKNNQHLDEIRKVMRELGYDNKTIDDGLWRIKNGYKDSK